MLLALLFSTSMWLYVYRVLVPYQRADAVAHNRPRGNLSDLYPRWLGARELLLHRRNPYSPEITRAIQAGYYGRELDPHRPGDPMDQQAFAYPVYVAFLLAPTVGYPFERVMVGFKGLLLVLTIASVGLWLRAVRWQPEPATVVMLAVLTLGSFSTVQGFKLQQLSLLVAFIIALGAALLATGHLFSAGFALAVSTIKPQLVLPLLVCLLLWTAGEWAERQPLFWGFALAMAILLGGAELILPGWMSDFRSAARDYRRYAGGQSLLDQLLSRGVGRTFSVAALVMLLLVCWRLRTVQAQSREFSQMLATVLAVTLIVIPMSAPYNQLLLLPAVVVIVRQWRELWGKNVLSRGACCLTVAIVGWPWLASLALAIASFGLSPGMVERGWAIPLYTSLAIPFVLLIQLGSLVGDAWAGSASQSGVASVP
ncbi:MAG TPA: glycosyltransferase 87 family protein [Terriglobales bacterium]|nr:glycosyltransferase 87 family protein [Terriglobales bacterium]